MNGDRKNIQDISVISSVDFYIELDRPNAISEVSCM